jgi:hypothetical protein
MWIKISWSLNLSSSCSWIEVFRFCEVKQKYGKHYQQGLIGIEIENFDIGFNSSAKEFQRVWKSPLIDDFWF